MSEASLYESIPLDKIRLDGGTQSRTTIDEALVAEYVALIKGGATMDAVACVAALAHLLDLRRHLRGVVDGAAGGSA